MPEQETKRKRGALVFTPSYDPFGLKARSRHDQCTWQAIFRSRAETPKPHFPQGNSPEDEVCREEVRQLIDQCIEECRERPKRVLVEYFYEGRSLTEIGKRYKVSAGRIKDILIDAVRQMLPRIAWHERAGPDDYPDEFRRNYNV